MYILYISISPPPPNLRYCLQRDGEGEGERLKYCIIYTPVVRCSHVSNFDDCVKEKDADKQLLLNILGDLSSETFVLLGKHEYT